MAAARVSASVAMYLAMTSLATFCRSVSLSMDLSSEVRMRLSGPFLTHFS